MKRFMFIIMVLGIVVLSGFTSTNKEVKEQSQYRRIENLKLGSTIVFTDGTRQWKEVLTQELKQNMLNAAKVQLSLNVTCYQVCIANTLMQCCVYPTGQTCTSLGWYCNSGGGI